MPVHDWGRVDANMFHHFHQAWTVSICDALNSGLLPPGFSALVEQRNGRPEADVLALERRSRSARPIAGGLMTATQPKTSLIKQARTALTARGNRIVVRHRMAEIICVMEIVSPGNKSSRRALRSFVDKTVDYLLNGVHMLVIDLLPPTKRDPQGIHKAIWDEIEDEPFELPAEKNLTLAAYEADDEAADSEVTAYVEPVGVGDLLPDMPAYLYHGGYVPVPLEATYQAAWATCPGDMRILVETGKLPGEEAE